jgi:hypothetical protein
MSTFCPRAILCSLLLAATFTPALADYKDQYKDGVEAAKRGDWVAVERHMRSAIGERPQEGVRLAALFFRNYLPHYYLGLARFEQGDCRSALESWETSANQGAIQKSAEEWSNLQSKRKTCQNRMAEVETAAREARALLAGARDLAGRVAALARAPELNAAWNAGSEPTLGGRQRRLDDELRAAEARLERGSTTLSVGEVREAGIAANQTAAAFQSLLSDATRRRDEVRSALAARRGALQVAAGDARRAVTALGRITPAPASVTQARAAIETLLRQVDSLPELPDPAEMDKLEEQLRAATGRARRLAEPPPEALIGVVDAYLTGNYRGVLEGLETVPRDPRSRPLLCLLRAAASFALWSLGGEHDSALYEAAREAVRECKALGAAAPKPTPELFSPRFVEFWMLP